MYKRWVLVSLLLVAGCYLLNVAGGKFFAADVPVDFYEDPDAKDQFIFWGYAYFFLSLVSIIAAIVIAIRGIIKRRA